MILAAAVLGAVSAPAAQPSTDRIVIREPAEGAAVVGRAALTVAIAASSSAVRVTMFADGRELCVLERAPWTCRWDAGPDVREHHVRVVAVLADGRRLVANARTQGIEVSETVRVPAVQVPVTVTGSDGRFVTGLTADAFTLLEDGRPQRIDTVLDASLPLELVVGIDISGSMEPVMTEVQVAVKRLLRQLRPHDTATLVGFNDTTFVLTERESDEALRAAAVEGLVPWGGTAFYDATVQALDLVGQHPGRRGIIMFSDGDDRHSIGRRDDSLRRVEEGQVALYTVGFGDDTSDRFRDTLAAFAHASGGRAHFPRRARDLDGTFESILSELSHQYVLTYVSDAKDAGGWRNLEVRAACERCRVRAREGYRAVE